jgi:hypothetical protein
MSSSLIAWPSTTQFLGKKIKIDVIFCNYLFGNKILERRKSALSSGTPKLRWVRKSPGCRSKRKK